MRSEPGLGRIVRLYFLYENTCGHNNPRQITWCHTIGEDYAAGIGEGIVVKVAGEVTRLEAVTRLRELATDLEHGSGFFSEINPDKTRLPESPPTNDAMSDEMPL